MNSIGQVIQIAVAPVFLLSGVGVMLSVFTGRLSRIVDRARVLEERLGFAGGRHESEVQSELDTLSRRSRVIDRAISLGICAGMLVCMVIVALFVGDLFAIDLSVAIAVLFVLAMLAFIGAFTCFLREVLIATKNLRVGRK
jgi:Protein of unknown function (DUF2721)